MTSVSAKICSGKSFFILLFLIFISAGNIAFAQRYCIDNRFSQNAYFDSSDIHVDTNIIYGIAPNLFSLHNDTLRMDVYYPSASTDTLSQRPFILTIHGGSFLSGDKQDMAYVCMEYARRGFVAATINYRLGWGCSATDLLGICLQCSGLNMNAMTATYCAAQDGRTAMRFIHANANTYRIDTANLFVGGVSAGSITALHTAFLDQWEADQVAPWVHAQAGALDSSGNTLHDYFSVKGVVDDCGAVSKDSIVLNNGNIPVISFHDESDCVVPNGYGRVMSCLCQPFYSVAGSSVIYGKLTSNGICAELNVVPGSLNHCSYPALQLVKRSSCFLKKIMCGSCTSLYTTNINLPVDCDSILYNGLAEDLSDEFNFSLSPNPAQDEVTIRLKNRGEASSFVTFIDVTGRVLYSERIHGNEAIIDTRNWSDGLFFCKLETAGKTMMKKLVIAHH